MLIRISLLLLLTFPLYPSQHFPVSQAAVDHQIRLAENKVLKARNKLLQAQFDKAPEEDIKKHDDEVRRTATDMLFVLALLREHDLRLEDIDFCMTHNADVNALDEINTPPLFHAVRSNITLVRELLKAQADVHYAVKTVLGDETTALIMASSCSMAVIAGVNPNKSILLEAGVTTMIAAINETQLLPVVLLPIIVGYAFGELPNKINSEVNDEAGTEE